MPELPEVEFARSVIERAALGRRITEVDDSDTYVCRPHPPGLLRDALTGRRLVSAHRRGKSMWCETDGGPVLGVHLGMSGKIVVAGPDGTEADGGDHWEGRRAPGDYGWARFTVTFEDGGRLMLVDPRRLGRIVLDPALDDLGPDAATIGAGEFRAAVTGGTAAVKARLLDQHAIAGIGNLLADEILWRARVHPARPVDELDRADVGRLLRATRGAVSAALRHGGVHTLDVVPFRKAGARCPRDQAPMVRGRAGGRTSWWCGAEQRLPGDA
ncbi:DNA-formamidopyrimidine glycosylase family protein [Amycolatopsis mongoliensis]|uniref:DNA-formamidopyrimidine glycosylase family protein n=1 Tax=Amycolatopsis mongoliensis TaxID=715475 RepID=A0A9Y2JJD3_9PSEU|nr:DNA-formamidopyrimidine glycosylase family protein [Amycolatopsis sp. 4-36]WIX98361.1 DNA-formamidopyrimidine glycosylase family protein [Amycolatopsis sp. 4-36]